MRWRHRRAARVWLLWMAAILGFALENLNAADGLQATFKPLAVRGRNAAPEAVDVQLNWPGPGLLEGRLEFSFYDAGAPPLIVRTQELVLTGGAQSFRFLLPTLRSPTDFPREGRMRFVGKNKTLELGRFSFGSMTDAKRTFLIAVGRSSLQRDVAEHPLWQSLRWERFEPEAAAETSERPGQRALRLLHFSGPQVEHRKKITA